MVSNGKEHSVSQGATKAQPVTLSSVIHDRPLDFLYVVFFLIHVPATLLLDMQSIYPKWLIPEDSPFRILNELYVNMTHDPVIGGVTGLFGKEALESTFWVSCFMHLELLIQLPTFLYGAHHLYHNTDLHILYPLLTIYGASTATTTLPCLVLVLKTHSAESVVGSKVALDIATALTDGQRWLLLASYIPFLLIPLGMAVDMAFRTSAFIKKGLKATKAD
ncbi:hypothetical protein FA15DRAFT_616240 [Coprinopsis marcescibilis]|uniref:EXPERA domain-containing protein n=1 Tax=Coprinopsis marcescibilis TaxID=230819 RepID=A0A5C3KZU3_COPMA|nr:hypothetical protein FA15DRAFT_616240 [Coprinopsis marcescibilis]